MKKKLQPAVLNFLGPQKIYVQVQWFGVVLLVDKIQSDNKILRPVRIIFIPDFFAEPNKGPQCAEGNVQRILLVFSRCSDDPYPEIRMLLPHCVIRVPYEFQAGPRSILVSFVDNAQFQQDNPDLPRISK